MAIIGIIWIPLGIFEIVPLLLKLPGESAVRTHAGVAVACLLLSSWCYWEN